MTDNIHIHTNDEQQRHHHKNYSIFAHMTNDRAILLGAVLISLAILGHGFIVASSGSKSASGLVDKAVITAIVKAPDLPHRYFGDQNPAEEIIMTEYSDTECPFCKNFHASMVQVVTDGAGRIAWVYKHFPLSFHPNAQKEAEAIECVREVEGDAKAFKYIDAIFATTPSNNKLPKEALFEISDAMKFKTKKIRECTESGKYAQKIKDEITEGEKIGVQGTPFTFVDQNKGGVKTALGTINGAQPIEAITAIIAQAK